MKFSLRKSTIAAVVAAITCLSPTVANAQTQAFHDSVVGVSETGEELFLPIATDNDDLNSGTEAVGLSGFPNTATSQDRDTTVGTYSIIGTDDRQKAAPNPAIVQIQRDGFNHCTGWMISPDTLITAAHCLYDVDEQRWTPKLIFRPSDWSQWSYTFASQKWVSAEYPTTKSADHDWGVVKFSKPISSSWFGIKPSDTSSAFSGQKATVTGFPGEKGNSLIRDYGQLWTMSGILQPGTQTRLCYNLDTTGGQSGSPVYTTDNAAIGIHTHGISQLGCPENSALRISPSMLKTFNDIKEIQNNATTDPGSSSGSSSH